MNGFNGFFAGIGPKLAAEIGPTDVSFDSYLKGDKTSSFEFSRISEIDILYTCRQLKPKLSSGADFISTKLLKQIAPIIITPLHYLINLSLETGFVPKELKIAKMALFSKMVIVTLSINIGQYHCSAHFLSSLKRLLQSSC